MSSPPISAGNVNPYYGEAPMVDILIHSQKINLRMAGATLGLAAITLIGIIAYVVVTQGLKGQITETSLGTGLTLVTGVISKVGINAITAHLGELQAARYLASLPSLTPEQVAQFNALMALRTK
jgi:pheromone shutdown protein TraB